MALTKVSRGLLSTGIVDNSNATAITIDSSENVGIGVVPKTGGSTWQHVQFGGTGNLIARKSDNIVDAMFANNYYVNASNADSYITTGAAARMFMNDNVISFDQAASGSTDAAISWSEAMRMDASGNLLVGKSSTNYANAGAELKSDGKVYSTVSGGASLVLNRKTNDGDIISFYKDNAAVGSIGTFSGDLTIGDDDVGLRFDTGTGLIPWDLGANSTGGAATNGAIDIGAASARFKDLYLSQDSYLRSVQLSDSDTARANGYVTELRTYYGNESLRLSLNTHKVISTTGYNVPNSILFHTYTGGSSSEKMRIDSSGNLLVGTSDDVVWDNSANSAADIGHNLRSDGRAGFAYYNATANSNATVNINRTGSNGDLIRLFKSGTTVGSIGTFVSSLTIGSGDTGLLLQPAYDRILPFNVSTNAGRDNAIDLGASDIRFDDIYATNGTIQTSDRNEKQDIAELNTAETAVAVACKGLLRKFRWKDSVAEKGDEARTHFGIIAQDLQAAFEAEGLDAGEYAMFISTTWTDEETNEEKTRMGVRYSELLAFIIAAI